MIKDIKLKRTGHNTYDWTFNGLDLTTITGRYQLVQSVKHAVLLRPDELIQSCYEGKGCHVHDKVYTSNHHLELEEKAALVEETVKEIKGVHTAQCDLSYTDYETHINLTLVTDDMQVVKVNEI